ncbi:hypothetical protein BC629DRAFT_473229 [Irpex lacteus]|nr:hypothetical protein BC629DRAFT_473229 [Irpex lacteus]
MVTYAASAQDVDVLNAGEISNSIGSSVMRVGHQLRENLGPNLNSGVPVPYYDCEKLKRTLREPQLSRTQRIVSGAVKFLQCHQIEHGAPLHTTAAYKTGFASISLCFSPSFSQKLTFIIPPTSPHSCRLPDCAMERALRTMVSHVSPKSGTASFDPGNIETVDLLSHALLRRFAFSENSFPGTSENHTRTSDHHRARSIKEVSCINKCSSTSLRAVPMNTLTELVVIGWRSLRWRLSLTRNRRIMRRHKTIIHSRFRVDCSGSC